MGARWIERNKRVQRSIANVIERENTAVNNAVESVIAASGGSEGGSIALPSVFTWYYDNRTSGAGTEPDGDYTIFDFTMVGGMIYVGETGKWISRIGVRVVTGATDATARLSLYAATGNATTPALAGTLIEDFGTVAVATSGFKTADSAVEVEAEPGFYWILVEPSAEITIAGFTSYAGYLGQNQTDGAVYSGMSYNIGGDPLDPHPALIDGGNREPVAPLVLFRLSDVD